MSTLTAEQAALLATDRWAWLADFLDRWYAEPLRAEDGGTAGDVAAAGERVGKVGRDLPRVLVEWFTLVGRRLRMVQNDPATPAKLYTADGMLTVWTENQGGWVIQVDPADDGDDPACILGGPTAERIDPTPLSMVLRSMILSETLIGAWSGTHIGPLGRLAPAVRGGMDTQATEAEVAAITGAYDPLPIPCIPDYGESLRGDQSTVVRHETWLEWMTADDDAYARIAGLIDLDPEGGEHEVVLALEDLRPEQLSLVTGEHGATRHDFVQDAVDGLGRLRVAATTLDGVRYQVGTTCPEETSRALLAALPDMLTDKAVLAVRPMRISAFRVIHPADRAEYTLPIY
ncbi:hypothetical protein AB0I28_32245 [Phytomonospora sp. NPDC050363]|uniref:hypothetical protein n=1 Tax=Phytomonospora sp. NPDC050363 TaxID=3155642 RepID=UPI0033CDF7CF